MNSKVVADTVVSTINMPSADLITYRFDQTDRKLAELYDKLDTLGANFYNKEEINLMARARDERLDNLERALANYRWYWRAIVTATLFAIGASIAALIGRY